MYDNGFKPYKRLIIPKGNLRGMFSHWHGCGSCLEMELIRDLEVPRNIPHKTEYDRCEIGKGYCINEVYGMDLSVWGREIVPVYESLPADNQTNDKEE